MRTTVTLEADVAAEIERMRREHGLGPSEALNRLARLGMVRGATDRAPYVHVSQPVGIRVDVRNIGDVLDMLDDRV